MRGYHAVVAAALILQLAPVAAHAGKMVDAVMAKQRAEAKYATELAKLPRGATEKEKTALWRKTVGPAEVKAFNTGQSIIKDAEKSIRRTVFTEIAKVVGTEIGVPKWITDSGAKWEGTKLSKDDADSDAMPETAPDAKSASKKGKGSDTYSTPREDVAVDGSGLEKEVVFGGKRRKAEEAAPVEKAGTGIDGSKLDPEIEFKKAWTNQGGAPSAAPKSK